MVLFPVVKAIIVRLVFFVHCFIATWRVVNFYQDSNFWWLLALLLGLLVEAVVTLWVRQGEEWRWFSPAVFLYLLAILPCIWLLELRLTGLRIEEVSQIHNNLTSNTSVEDSIIGITINLNEFGWTLALEQCLFLFLILGRWILPRGETTRDELSQILLVNMGMAADIMELFEVFEENKFVLNSVLVYPTLSLWTWSLLQYCLVITSTKARKSRFGGTEEDSTNNEGPHLHISCPCKLPRYNADVVGIVITLVMQDVPFFIFRVYLLGGVGIRSHMMLFFTCKNALVIILQIYRLVIILSKKNDADENPEELEHDLAGPSNNERLTTPRRKLSLNRVSPAPPRTPSFLEVKDDSSDGSLSAASPPLYSNVSNNQGSNLHGLDSST